ncbi:hypothetical protein I79_023281 [Cricetulus griseus]|uniref:Uncharacterized protein n=1 Tax=Cricetulus griseus TaxID=10029 RepID=G3IHJ1_CRIGR|nr:hypothetical protein I79_023281 [Cricetulus griseus]
MLSMQHGSSRCLPVVSDNSTQHTNRLMQNAWQNKRLQMIPDSEFQRTNLIQCSLTPLIQIWMSMVIHEIQRQVQLNSEWTTVYSNATIYGLF